ncbi:hypothetical protein RYX36_027737 [Vicia faba]
MVAGGFPPAVIYIAFQCRAFLSVCNSFFVADYNLSSEITSNKPWHWRKKSIEKIISADEKVVSPSQVIEKEEPLHPLTCVQEEQVPRVSISKISKEHENVQKELEEKLREANKRIDELTDKNASLTNALFFKEESVAEILQCKQEADAEFKTLRLKHTRLTKH